MADDTIRDEIEELVKALALEASVQEAFGLAGGLEITFEEWIDAMVNQTEMAAAAAEGGYYDVLRASVTAPTDPVALEAARKAWLDQARIQARTLAVNLTGTQMRTMSEEIARGLADGLNPLDIARNLTSVQDLDPQRASRLAKARKAWAKAGLKPEDIEARVARLKAKLLRDRRETIARTEARNATSQARLDSAQIRGDKWKSWSNAGDARVSPPCESNGLQGAIPIRQAFASGVQRTPEHPRCRCSVVYGKTDAEKKRMDKRAEGKQEQLVAAQKAEAELEVEDGEVELE